MSYNANGLINNDGTITQYGNTASRGGGSGNGIVEQSLEITKLSSFSLPTMAGEPVSDIIPFVYDDTLYLYFSSSNHGGFNVGDVYSLNDETLEWDYQFNQPKTITSLNWVAFNGLLYFMNSTSYFTFDGEGFSNNITYPNGMTLATSTYNLPAFAVLDDKIILVDSTGDKYDNRFVTYALDDEGNIELFCVYDEKRTDWNDTCLLSCNDVLYAKNPNISLAYNKEDGQWWRVKSGSTPLPYMCVSGYRFVNYKNKIVVFYTPNSTTLSTQVFLEVNGTHINFSSFGYSTWSSRIVVYKNKIWIIGDGTIPYNRVLTYVGDSSLTEKDIKSRFFKKGNRKEVVLGQSDGTIDTNCNNNSFMANDDLYYYKRLNKDFCALYKYNFTQKKFELLADSLPKEYCKCTMPIGNKLYGLGNYGNSQLYTVDLYNTGTTIWSVDIVTGEYESFVVKSDSSSYYNVQATQFFWFNNCIYLVSNSGTFRFDGNTNYWVYVAGVPNYYVYSGSSTAFNTQQNVINGGYIYFVSRLSSKSNYSNYIRTFWRFNGTTWYETQISDFNRNWTTYYMHLFSYNNLVYVYFENSTYYSNSGYLYHLSNNSYSIDYSNTVPKRLINIIVANDNNIDYSTPFLKYYSSDKKGTFLCINNNIDKTSYYNASSNYNIYARDTSSRVFFIGDDATEGYSIGFPTVQYATPLYARSFNDIINYNGNKYWINGIGDLYVYNQNSETWEYKNTVTAMTANNGQTVSGIVYNNNLYIATLTGLHKYDENNNSFTRTAYTTISSNTIDLVIYNNNLHIIGLSSSYVNNKHYVFDGTSITDKSTDISVPAISNCSDGHICFVDNNKLNIIGIQFDNTYQGSNPFRYCYFDTTWHQGTEPSCMGTEKMNLSTKSFFRYEDDMYCIITRYVDTDTYYRPKNVYLGKIVQTDSTYTISNTEMLLNSVFTYSSENKIEIGALLDKNENGVIWYNCGNFIEYLNMPSSGSGSSYFKYATYPVFDPVYILPQDKIEKGNEPIGTNIPLSVQEKELYTTKINLSEGRTIRGTELYTVVGDTTLQSDGTYTMNSTGDVVITSGSPITLI